MVRDEEVGDGLPTIAKRLILKARGYLARFEQGIARVRRG